MHVWREIPSTASIINQLECPYLSTVSTLFLTFALLEYLACARKVDAELPLSMY
jgi:hypothetical protein